jgi:hypothetical protein
MTAPGGCATECVERLAARRRPDASSARRQRGHGGAHQAQGAGSGGVRHDGGVRGARDGQRRQRDGGHAGCAHRLGGARARRGARPATPPRGSRSPRRRRRRPHASAGTRTRRRRATVAGSALPRQPSPRAGRGWRRRPGDVRQGVRGRDAGHHGGPVGRSVATRRSARPASRGGGRLRSGALSGSINVEFCFRLAPPLPRQGQPSTAAPCRETMVTTSRKTAPRGWP